MSEEVEVRRGPGRPRKEQEPRKLLPTPPVGTPVQWFKCGDNRFPCAAVVLQVNPSAPGHLELSICIGSGWIRQPDVTWAGDPKWSESNTAQVRNNGTWDKLPKYEFDAVDYGIHEVLLEKRQAAKEREVIEVERRKQEYEASLTATPDPIAVEVARVQAQMIVTGSL
jgi:hypothetical protein